MKKEVITCDIEGETHGVEMKSLTIKVVFDHDQEDGRSREEPYLQSKDLDICVTCYKKMLKERRLIYAYGAMGYNKYYLDR